MSINKRQFELLKAMGVDVWQRRELTNTAKNNEPETCKNQIDNNLTIALDLKQLLKERLFNDIITSIGIEPSEITIDEQRLNLGIINWAFHNKDEVSFDNNCLYTPLLPVVATSSDYKRSLWQHLAPLSNQ